MNDYDFHILQPNEFECLTRDLLQKREGIFIESFTSGRDGGIDMRFASASPRGATIVQAKRYKDYDTLLRTLKQEVVKMKRLNPERYILSTSVGLTPANKEEILSLFEPYIKNTTDILGRGDLNNLLGLNPDIEDQYYKLWIASTNVMNRILHRRIENWSGFERAEIEKDVATYVMNDSFNEAMSVLLKNRFVIISGIPGIGKTTLARMLVYKLLGEDYEEVIRISSMEDAAEKLIEGKRQVFFFDDFLGANYFHVTEDSFESKVLRFIDAIRRNSDKLFILSTREYILKSAMRKYEHFAIRNIELAKCTIDLEDYSEDVRAHILYNHLAEASIPTDYIRQLLSGARYLKIIKHQNFNPRIIEAFLSKQLYRSVSPERFVTQFLAFFEHPNSVWDYAFRNIPSLAQYALFVRMTMGNGQVYLNDWYAAVKHFVRENAAELTLSISEMTWEEECLKVLEGTFVLTSPNGAALVVGFHNPSVFDFLLDKVRDYKEVQTMLIRTALFADQVYGFFSDVPTIDRHSKVQIAPTLYPAVRVAYEYALCHLRVCQLKELGSSLFKISIDIVGFLIKMSDAFPVLFKNNPELIGNVVNQEMFESNEFHLNNRMSLLSRLDSNGLGKLDLERLAQIVYKQADWTDEFIDILDLLEMTVSGREILESDELLHRVESSLDAELKSASNEEECDMISEAASVLAEKILGLNSSIWEAASEEEKARFSAEPDDDIDEDWARESYYRSRSSDDKTYGEMFSSLLG